MSEKISLDSSDINKRLKGVRCGSFYFLFKKMSYTCSVLHIQLKSNIYDSII